MMMMMCDGRIVVRRARGSHGKAIGNGTRAGARDTGTHQASRADAFLLVVGVEHRLELDGVHCGRKRGVTSDRDETGRASGSVPWFVLNRGSSRWWIAGRFPGRRARSRHHPRPSPSTDERVEETRLDARPDGRLRGGVRDRDASKTLTT